MKQEKIFKTKTGFCHVMPDKIVLTRDGVIGNMAGVTVGNSISRILLIYGTISVALLYFCYVSYENGQTFQPIFYGLGGVYLIYGIVISLNNSTTPIIDRQKIREVRFKKAIKGLTRARFEVMFEDQNGKIKKRLILLPGSFSNGDIETEKAVKIIREEQLLK